MNATDELIDDFERAVSANGYRTQDRYTEEEYRRARAAIRAALTAAPASAAEPVAWLPAEDAPRGVHALIRHRSGQIDVAYKTNNGEPFLETWRYAGTARRGEQAPWPDSYLPIKAVFAGPEVTP